MVDYHALRLHVQNNSLSSFTIQQIAYNFYFPLHYELAIRSIFLFFIDAGVPITDEFQ